MRICIGYRIECDYCEKKLSLKTCIKLYHNDTGMRADEGESHFCNRTCAKMSYDCYLENQKEFAAYYKLKEYLETKNENL